MTGMVRAIAAQVWGIYSSFAQLDDIVEEGILVLLSAVDKFDPSNFGCDQSSDWLACFV